MRALQCNDDNIRKRFKTDAVDVGRFSEVCSVDTDRSAVRFVRTYTLVIGFRNKSLWPPPFVHSAFLAILPLNSLSRYIMFN